MNKKIHMIENLNVICFNSKLFFLNRFKQIRYANFGLWQHYLLLSN